MKKQPALTRRHFVGGTAFLAGAAALPSLLRAQNAALTATLMMVKAEALDLTGDTAAARALRLDSLGWARYGFGSSEDVRRRLDDIATLSPARRFAKQ